MLCCINTSSHSLVLLSTQNTKMQLVYVGDCNVVAAAVEGVGFMKIFSNI